MAYECKGLNQSNNVCEYEQILSTNEKVITEKQNFQGQEGHNATCW